MSNNSSDERITQPSAAPSSVAMHTSCSTALSTQLRPASLRALLERLWTLARHRSTAALHRVHTRLVTSSPVYARCFTRVRALPIAEFYLYMWRVEPTLFARTMFVNYALPVVMEAMPWYLSRRKISRLLRESRNSITHRLVAAEPFSDSAIAQFVLFSLVYALVQTVEQIARTRVMLENRLLIKRLVLERILYSELGSLQDRYFAVFGEEVRTEQLEAYVFNDIAETLNLFNTTVPGLIRGAYTLVGSAHDLWLNRAAFDVLAILRPSLVGLTSEVVNYFREKYVVDQQTLQMQRNNTAMSRVVTNIVDGLAEIQINNMQAYQLSKLDQLASTELSHQQGWTTFGNNIYRQVSQRSVFDFASEVYVVRLVMARRGINHETYRKIQNDIDYATRLFGRLWSQGRDAYRVYETQGRVIQLLNLPSFIREARLRDHLKSASDDDDENAADAEEAAAASEQSQLLATREFEDFSLPASEPAAVGSDVTAPTSVPSTLDLTPNTTAAPFEFDSLLFRRCVFRYKPNLPLALNIHPRAPGEVLVTDTSVECPNDGNIECESLPSTSPSTDPKALLEEIDRVLRHPHHRLPSAILHQRDLLVASVATVTESSVPVAPPTAADSEEESPPAVPAPSSAVMSDIMQSRDSTEDEDGNVTAEANVTNDVVADDPIDDVSTLRELETLVKHAEEQNAFLEFAAVQPTAGHSVLGEPTAPPNLVSTPSPPPLVRTPSSSVTSTVPPTKALFTRAVSAPAMSSSPSFASSPSSPSASTVCEPGTLLFERGRTYALIGENRSGKSTLMQILCKLYQPTASNAAASSTVATVPLSSSLASVASSLSINGASTVANASSDTCDILLNGAIDFTTVPRMLLRDRVSYVAQRPFIFPGTIEENIRNGDTSATIEEVERAAEMAGIFAMEKPKPLSSAASGAGGPGAPRSLVDRSQNTHAIALKPWEQNRLKSVLLAVGAWTKRQWMRLHGLDESDEAEFEQSLAPEEEEEQKEESLSAQASPVTASSSVDASSPPRRTIHPTLLLETAERGANLSGGFAQSVALARIFLRKRAQIVILDESMGQMDAIKKRELIFPRLFEFVRAHRMTLILISHDVPLVCKLVDTVYVMQQGQCVQCGTHADLMRERGGAYARLVGSEEDEARRAAVNDDAADEDEQRSDEALP